jgi:UDP-2,4-diacetamido-2,4,6-trideoxy-beta-L-altropyranose hydrolase
VKERKVLLLRADGSAQIGTGHLMRCLALGQAWREAGGEVLFITACREGALLQRLEDEGFSVHPIRETYPHKEDWEVTGACLKRNSGAWLVLDGYHFDEAYHSLLKAAGARVMIIDDMAHLAHYEADIVLNQNIHGPCLSYPVGPETKLLGGTPYALLRREFLAWQGWKREVPEVARKILVTLGGADPENITRKVIQGLKKIPVRPLEVSVVVGPANLRLKDIDEELSSAPFSYRLLQSVKDMPRLMAWADVAISAAGSTVWELAFMGLPALLLVVAKNQRGAARKLQQERIFRILGAEDRVESKGIGENLSGLVGKREVRRKMSKRARLLVDGLGAKRVADILRGAGP